MVRTLLAGGIQRPGAGREGLSPWVGEAEGMVWVGGQS